MKVGLLSLPFLVSACLAQTVLIRGARVFNGETIVGVRDVIVSAGKIVEVAPTLQAPKGAEIVDARGKVLLPGLIDSHTHIQVAGLEASLRKLVLFGVTTTISLFDARQTPREMHEWAHKAPLGEFADFLTAGMVVTPKGGHGTQYGVPIPTLDDASEAQSFVDARIAEGSDVIKIMYDDFGGSVQRLPKETMKAAIEAAHARGKLAVVHAGGSARHVRDAIQAGADGVVHSFFDSVADTDYGKMFVDRGAFLMPTFSLQASVCALPDNAAISRDPRIAPWLTPAEAKRLRTAVGTVEEHADCVGSFASIPGVRDAGATILAGSDAPNPGTAFGASIHGELELLVRCGLSPEQALVSATSAAARVWRFKDRGRIAPGLRADLVLVDGDPTKEITRTRDISAIWLAGVRVNRATLLEKIRKSEQQ